ncbi:MAG: hypothetical protein ACREXR_08755, partial [Gammaproteobacteria bacterium]
LDPAFQVHEIVTGPINAGIFPNAAFDPTLGTVSLFRFPTTTPANYEEAKQMFNFGLIKIAQDGRLTASINGIDGAALYELPLHLH